MKRLFVNLVMLCLFFVSPAFAVDGDDILGFWVTEGGDARVEVFKKGTLYFARIVGLKEPRYKRGEVKGMDGKARVDDKNPDGSLRDRPLLGLEMMRGFSFEDGKWVDGRIYDPKNGKSYKCKLSLTILRTVFVILGVQIS